MYREDHRSSFSSDYDTTNGSLNFHNESSQQINRLQDGTLEITDTLPKKEYYMSLRKNDTRMSTGSLGRIAGSTVGLGTLSAGTIRPGFFGQRTQSVLDFKPSGKTIEVVVVLLDGNEEIFNVDKQGYGQHLFDMVCDHLELNEREYFGITYKDTMKVWYWLDLTKKILKQTKEDRLYFEFQVKFYPPTLSIIVEDLTRYYFCLQIRQDLVSGQLPCSFFIYVLLASYSIQSEAGDFDPETHKGIDYVRDQPFAPQQFQTNEMLYRIVESHKSNRGQTPEEADRNFLDNARKLALYGVDRHKVKSSEGEEETIGVYHGGLLIYRNRIRVLQFAWARLLKVSYKNKKVILNIRHTKGALFYKCRDTKMAKRLYQTIIDHHYFFRMIEFGVPKKPNLKPGFATRKYYKNPNSPNNSMRDLSYDMGAGNTGTLRSNASGGSRNNMSNHLNNSQPKPKIKRHPPQARKEQTDGGWYTLPNKQGNIVTSSPNRPTVPRSPNAYFPTTPTIGENADFKETTNDATQTNLLAGIGPRPTLPPFHWRMSPADCTLSVGMDEKGLDLASQHGDGWQGCRATRGIKSNGEYFFETRLLEDGEIRVGWSTNDASLNLGSDKEGYGFGQSGLTHGDKLYPDYKVKPDANGNVMRLGDYIGCRIDLDKGEMAYYVNGRALGPIPEVIPEELRREPFFPTLTVKDGRADMNFGEFAAFVFPPSDSDTWMPICTSDETNQAPNKLEGWRLNAYDSTQGMDVAAAGLAAQSQLGQGWQGVRANKGVRGGRGKYYYEATNLEVDGLARIGWSTEASNNLDNLGGDGQGFGYGADNDGFGLSGNQGKKMFRNDIENYGRAFKKDDTIGCMLNLDEGTLQWSLNGEIFSKAYDIPLELRNGPYGFYPHVCMKNNTMDFNFGEKMFKFYPGNEWTPLTYTPEQFMKSSRKKGPERKVRGWSYLGPDMGNAKTSPQNGDTENKELPTSEEHKPSKPNLAIIIDEVQTDDSGSYQPNIVNKSGTRTVTNGEVTEVKLEDPNVETDEYIDEHGNLVKKTITRTKKITKTTKTMSELVTERSENDVASNSTNKISVNKKSVIVNPEDDYDDEILRNAILAVTLTDANTLVLNDYVGSLEFVTNANNSKNSSSNGTSLNNSSNNALESEI